MFTDIFQYIAIGSATAFAPDNLLYCFIGVFLGMIVGVLPGIGPLAALSMLFPLTFYLDSTTSLIMLAGIWYGTAYGGTIASVLLNVPGTTSSAVTCLDGYPMARQGRAGVALLMTTLSSFVGASIGIIIMMLFSPIIVQYALQFGPAEYFALILLGFVAASAVSDGAISTNFAMVTLGVVLGIVGLDINSGQERFTFGQNNLYDGLSLGALAMGLFGVTEVILRAQSKGDDTIVAKSVTFRSMIPNKDDRRRFWLPTFRGSAIGSFFGTLPGTGPTIASFMSYILEKKVAREPQRFGKGAIEGVIGPEAANNAADQTAFIPTLTLGIPGSASMAIMLGALMIQGINPGPDLMTNHPDLFWGIVMSFWVGNLLLLILNIPLIGLWIRLLTIPFNLLYPAIVIFIAIGVYSLHYNPFDVWMVLIFGAAGYVFKILALPTAPVLMGFVLGPLMEEQFRRSLLIAGGDASVFLTRPISATVLGITAAVLLFFLVSPYAQPRLKALLARTKTPPIG